MNITHLGLIAGGLTSSAIIPQILKAYRTRKVRDISLWQPLLLNIGIALWLWYGLIIGDMPLIAANAFSLFCNSLLIWMKFTYGRDDNRGVNDYICAKCQELEEL